MTELQQQLVEAVREHARENGWDVVNDVWEDEHIVQAIGRARSPKGAIEKVAAVVEAYEADRPDAGPGDEEPLEVGVADDVCRAILDGKYDGGFDQIRDAIRQRKRELLDAQAQMVAERLEPGQQVRVREDASLRPRYLLGLTAVVEEVGSKRAKVVFGPDARKYAQHPVKVPLHALEIA